MSYKREVCEMSLDGRVEYHLGFCVTERRPVLVKKVHQLPCNYPAKEKHYNE